MTNLEYIKDQMANRILVDKLFVKGNYTTLFKRQIKDVFLKWVDQFSANKESIFIEDEDLFSIWAYKDCFIRDKNEGHWEKCDQPQIVAFQTWLGHQYNKKDWEEDEND